MNTRNFVGESDDLFIAILYFFKVSRKCGMYLISIKYLLHLKLKVFTISQAVYDRRLVR